MPRELELDQAAEHRIVLVLELEDGLPSGRVCDPSGVVHPFHGWLELMSAIAAAAGTRMDAANPR